MPRQLHNFKIPLAEQFAWSEGFLLYGVVFIADAKGGPRNPARLLD